jgi:ABC-2 type transport system ATP-binding protein
LFAPSTSGLSANNALWQDNALEEDVDAVNAVPAVRVKDLRRQYGDRAALDGVSFSVACGEIFALLGPNGGGKTTLFKILSTLLPATSGEVDILGQSLTQNPHAVRSCLGIVFQHPSLDPKLTVMENLQHHGHLYGLRGKTLRERSVLMLKRLGLTDRANDIVETLSGGMQRRVELAKGLLHKPTLLLLDEPSTGLDPGARRDFNNYLQQLRNQDGVTIILTTHIMDEAERCDRVGILHQGKLVAMGTPDALKAQVGGDVVAIRAANLSEFREKLVGRFNCDPTVVDGSLRIERPRGHEFVREVVEAFPGEVQSITFGRPTLEDVFIHQTGHQFWEAEVHEGRMA